MKTRIVLITAAIVAVAAGCGAKPAIVGSGPTKVVAAFYPLAYAAEQVGGATVTVENLTPAGAEAQSRGGWAVVAVLKIVGLLALAWLLMRHAIVSPMPKLVGFGALPIGIAIGSLVSDRRPPPESEGG